MAAITLKQIGDRMARLRRRAGLTQAVVAERLGVSNETISRIERGVQWTDFRTLVGLSRLYNVHVAELLSVTNDDPNASGKGALIAEVVEILQRRSATDVVLARDVLKVLFRNNH